jgi:molecular chaperone GrpE
LIRQRNEKDMAKTPTQFNEEVETAQNTDPSTDPAGGGARGEAYAETLENAPPRGDAELAKVTQERDQLLDRLARLQAEFENARKRDARERAEFRDFAVAGAIEQLLPVLDNLNLALSVKGSGEQLRSGVELIVRQMEEAMRALGVQPIETVGAQFDPQVHEALGAIETTEVPDHQVMEEVRRGYRLKDRMLRPALVRVANNNQQQEA